MKTPYDELKEAIQKRENAEDDIRTARRRIETYEINIKAQLPLEKGIPCAVGILPDGRIAVHVFSPPSPCSSTQTELHIVTPTELKEV